MPCKLHKSTACVPCARAAQYEPCKLHAKIGCSYCVRQGPLAEQVRKTTPREWAGSYGLRRSDPPAKPSAGVTRITIGGGK